MKQYPSQFDTEDEIAKQLRRLFGLLPFDTGRLVARLFYDILKITYYIHMDKAGRVQPDSNRKVDLDRKEIARALDLVRYHHWNCESFAAKHDLSSCFGGFDEAETLRFCKTYLNGQSITDKFGRSIVFGQNPEVFLYKDELTGRHETAPGNYVSKRGKRLPWIRHTLRNSREIYEQRYKGFLVLMYVSEYSIELGDGKTDNCYWVVIARRGERDYRGAFKFKTAYPISDYNGLIRKLAGWRPARIPNKRAFEEK
ncbi:MAG: hypothetical protein V1694_01200 [Candidatus Eisenbacteria bacterium]